MVARGMNVEAFESYLMMHKAGMPPHGGLGIGLERLTAKLLNQEKIPLSLRERLPVVCDDGGICWAPRCPARTDGQKNKLYVYFYRVGGKDE